MRFTSLDLYSSDSDEFVKMSLKNSPGERFLIRNMIGLDADELVPKFYGFGATNKFYDFGMKEREVVIEIVPKPLLELDETYSDVRDILYRLISSSRSGELMLRLRNGATIEAQIPGFITKFEVAHFDQVPKIQLTLKCNDPILRSPTPIKYVTADLGTENPIILTDPISTAPHGFVMSVVFTGSADQFTISTSEWQFQVIPEDGFVLGDSLFMSSEATNRFLFMYRGEEQTHLIDKIVPSSVWPTIFPGVNEFTFDEIASFQFTEAQFYPAFWGV